MKIRKKQKRKLILLLIIIQIFLLVNMSFANSYNLDKIVDKKELKIDISNSKEFLKKGLGFFVSFFSIKKIGLVSAASDGGPETHCCKETENGTLCEDVLPSFDECKEDLVPNSCENIEECATGCCFGSEEGLCTPKSTYQECVSTGGEFIENEDCEVPKCEKGCCLINNKPNYVTETRCEKLSQEKGVEKNFKQTNETGCFNLAETSEKGACIYNENCRVTTRQECEGVFNPGQLCTSENLETECEPTEKTTCIEGKDEVYFVDSCGNIANVYDASKINDEDYWNQIITPENSCELDDLDNSDACGNCNRDLGSMCAPVSEAEGEVEYGNYKCRDLSCEDPYTGEIKRNGESWCIYNSLIGEQKSPFNNKFSADTIGSEHFIAECIDGEVEVRRCSEARTEVCAQREIKDDVDEDFTFSKASCVPNEANICLDQNKKAQKKCKDKKDNPEEQKKCIKNYFKDTCLEKEMCRIQEVDVSDSFAFDLCVPKYPKGFEMKPDEEKSEKYQKLCNLGTIKCTVLYVKELDGFDTEWNCKGNCECRTQEFAKQMNDLCVSLGDCGSYINYIGQGTDNTKISGSEGKKPDEVSWKKYKGFEEPNKEEYVNMTSYLKELLEKTYGENIDYTDVFTKEFDRENPTAWKAFWDDAFEEHELAGMNLEEFLISGSVIDPVTWGSIAATGLFINTLELIVSEILGLGDTKEKTVKFNCNPYQPQTGVSEDVCEKCNEMSEELDIRCTEHRCESLGKNCELINKDTENPTCEAMEDDDTAPQILLDREEINISDEFEISDIDTENRIIEIEHKQEGCVPAYEPFRFDLKTDEMAQCKYSFEEPNSKDYEDMPENYPVQGNAFTINHSFFMEMPSLESLNAEGVSRDSFRNLLGDAKMYIKCQDYFGNFNFKDYLVKFCVKEEDESPPEINKIEPKDESFVKFNASKEEIDVYLNEPSECRYSTQPDTNYEDMQNDMECNKNLQNPGRHGWKCSTELNLTQKENKFYFRCKDKPFEGIEEDKRVANSQDMKLPETGDSEYNLYVSQNPLKINSVKFASEIKEDKIKSENNSKIKTDREPISVEMKVETSGGADNGKSSCEWGVEKQGSRWLFEGDTELTTTHNQILSPRYSGKHVNYIKCEDDAGNVAETIGVFSIEIDKTPPSVIRAYRKNNELKVITDEKSSCYYTTNDGKRCDFNFDENSNSMETSLSKEHSIEAEEGETYYIKCEDIWENRNPGCAATIKYEKDLT